MIPKTFQQSKPDEIHWKVIREPARHKVYCNPISNPIPIMPIIYIPVFIFFSLDYRHIPFLKYVQ